MGWADVEACTLPTAQRPLRVAEFDSLFVTALRAIETTGSTSVRLLLAGEADVAERTQRLADAESSCCSFFTFRVTELDAGRVAFDIDVPQKHAGVLAGLVDQANAALRRPAANS